MTAFDRQVGADLKNARVKAGITQAALAFELRCRGLSAIRQTTIVKVEQGGRFLKLEEACAIADILAVDISALTYTAAQEQHQQAASLRQVRIQDEIAARQKEIDDLRAELDRDQ